MTGSRFGHRSIIDGDAIIHFGGDYTTRGRSTRNVPIERWILDPTADRFSIETSVTSFTNFFEYPELFVLDSAVC